jgi:hypothetical protein
MQSNNAIAVHHLPTIDDFVDAIQSIRAAYVRRNALFTRGHMRHGLRALLTRRRDAYFAGARDAADLEQRQQIWQREQFSSLFSH